MAKRRRRIMRRTAYAILALVALPYLLVTLYSVINPPLTSVMLLKRLGGASIHKSWMPIGEISPALVRSVLMAEDARFCSHLGVDWVEMRKAIDSAQDGGRLRGASTITMQTVKNLFLWTGRDWLRKGFELPLALYADLVLSKRRIMELYLNIVEWDRGVYGAEAAAQSYFGTSAAALGPSQAARLAAVLPAPEARNPLRPGPRTAQAANRIARSAAAAGAYDDCVLDEK